MSRPTCKGVKAQGTPCTKSATRGEYCWQHANQEPKTAPTGRPTDATDATPDAAGKRMANMPDYSQLSDDQLKGHAQELSRRQQAAKATKPTHVPSQSDATPARTTDLFARPTSKPAKQDFGTLCLAFCSTCEDCLGE